jgi:pimeloyl-ACP methyl ester carboxylesterase
MRDDATERLDVPIDVGNGRPIVMLPGFAMPPWLYRDTAELLAARGHCRVVVADIYHPHGRWSYDRVISQLMCALDALELGRVTMMSHSFAGGVQLGFAVQHAERIVELVFVDTLALSRELPLAREAMSHPFRLFRMATPEAAIAFDGSVLRGPIDIVRAAWWGFTSGRTVAAHQVAEAGMRSHVLWANRDSVLRRSDGQALAEDLNASFDVAREPNGRAIDHDWMYRHPQLFVEHIEALRLRALA